MAKKPSATTSRGATQRPAKGSPSAGLVDTPFHRPAIVHIALTNRCNLRCKMCELPQIANPDAMDTATVLALIRDLATLGAEMICFTGGEPLLRRDLPELSRAARFRGIYPIITTNGVLLNRNSVRELLCAGTWVVNVSIDGPQQVHDRLRGRGTFLKAVEGIREVVSTGMYATIATTVLTDNLPWLSYVVELAIELGASNMKFQPFCDTFLCNPNEGGRFRIHPADLPRLESELARAIRLAEAANLEINPRRYLFKLRDFFENAAVPKPRGVCPSFFNSTVIDYDGNVYGCWGIKDHPLGNVLERPFLEIWTSPEYDRQRELVRKMRCPGCLLSCYDGVFGADPMYRSWLRLLDGLSSRAYHRVNEALDRVENMTEV